MLEPIVCAVRTKDQPRSVAMARLINLLGFPGSATQIAIKLNLCDYRKWETGATSDPKVVGALLEALRARYHHAKIFLCENDSTDTLVENLWGYLGIDAVAARYDARCISLSKEAWTQVPIRGLRCSGLEVPALFQECDLFINHPKLKTHGKTRITCGLKNLFGCYRRKDKRLLHHYLDEAIVDINMAIRPHFVIVDADLCVEGNRGPTQGLPKQVGLFIGGQDPVAVDAFCARLMGFWPYAIGHLRKAARAGLGSFAYGLTGDLGPESIRAYRFQFSLSKFLFMGIVRRLLSWSEAR